MARGNTRMAVKRGSFTSFWDIPGKQVQRVIWDSRTYEHLYETHPGDQQVSVYGRQVTGDGSFTLLANFTLFWDGKIPWQGPTHSNRSIWGQGSQFILCPCLASHPHDPRCYGHLLPPASGRLRPKTRAKHSCNQALAGDREVNNEKSRL